MCLTTTTTVKPTTVELNGKPYLLAWKEFTSSQGEIRGTVYDDIPYKILKEENNFLRIEESAKATQNLDVLFTNKDGVMFLETSSRRIPIGMHVNLVYSPYLVGVPVLIPLHNIILFGDDGEATVDVMLLPTPEWATENLDLTKFQKEKLVEFMNLYAEEK